MKRSFTFVPNGSYGTVTFRAKSHGKYPDILTLTITGELKEAAQARLEAILNDIQRPAALAAILAALVIAVVAAAAGAITAIVTKGNVFITALATVLAALVTAAVLVNISETAYQSAESARERSKPVIANLPSRNK
jgi:hypothetical protein